MYSTTFPVTILAVSLKRIATDLDSTVSTVAWATTAPMLAAAVATPILGRLGDLRGHRRLFLIGFTICIVLAGFTVAAGNAGSLIALRTVGQLAGTATVPSSLAMLFRAYGPSGRLKVSAWGSSILASAAVSGLVVGGPLTDAFGWRLIFILQGGLSLVALLAALVVLRPADDVMQPGSIDWPGAGALAVTAFSGIFAVNRLPIWGPTPLVLGLLALFPVALYTFLRIERTASTPILPLALFQIREIRLSSIATFMIGGCWNGAFIITPILMQSVLGLSLSESSLASFPRATFIALAAPVAARLAMRHGERRVGLLGATTLACTMGLLAVASSLESIVLVVVAISLGGWFIGHVSPSLMSMASGSVADHDLGIATSLQQTSNQIGAVFGSGLVSAIAADADTPPRFIVGFLVCATLSLVAAVVISRTPRVAARPASVTVD